MPLKSHGLSTLLLGLAFLANTSPFPRHGPMSQNRPRGGKQSQETPQQTVFNIQLPNPAPEPAPQPCAANEPRTWRQHLSCGEPQAYSALGTWVAAFLTFFIGLIALRINSNTVRGQRIHEQIRMVLEIDKELIACPQLWGILEASPSATPMRPQAPVPQTVATALESLTVPLASLKTTLASQPFAPQTVATALENLTAPLDSLKTALQSQVNLSASELEGKKKALAFMYLNMFDYVHGFYARGFYTRRILMRLKPLGRDRQDWNAWRQYMKNFFDTSRVAQDIWDKDKKIKIYPKSFTDFIKKKRSLGPEEPW